MQVPPPDDGSQPILPRRRNLPLILTLVLGSGCCFATLILSAVLFPVFQQARTMAESSACMESLKNIGNATLMYSADHDDRLPHREWTDAAVTYSTASRLSCGTVAPQGPAGHGYALNRDAVGALWAAVEDPDSTLMIFDSSLLGANVMGGEELLPQPPRHRGGGVNNAYYFDGSVGRALGR
jgi:hypothetical protein